MTRTQLIGAITDLLIAGQKRTALQLRNLLIDIVNNVLAYDDSGNVGIGLTPSNWGNFKALEVYGTGGNAIAGAGAGVWLTANTYNNGTNWIYKVSYNASYYNQNGGVHSWYTSQSGIAGNIVSFTKVMSVDEKGNLLVGMAGAATASAKTLHLANATVPTGSPSGGGVLYVENGALKYRGSSGTVTTIANA